jgi:hypothetical protein
VLTGCIAGIGAPFWSHPPPPGRTAGIFGTGAPPVRKLDGFPDVFPAIVFTS